MEETFWSRGPEATGLLLPCTLSFFLSLFVKLRCLLTLIGWKPVDVNTSRGVTPASRRPVCIRDDSLIGQSPASPGGAATVLSSSSFSTSQRLGPNLLTGRENPTRFSSIKVGKSGGRWKVPFSPSDREVPFSWWEGAFRIPSVLEGASITYADQPFRRSWCSQALRLIRGPS